MSAHTPGSSRVVPIVVDEKLTRQVAHLARLDLTDEEVRLYTQQIGDVLGYIGEIQTIDTQGVEPLMHPFDLEPPLREDQVIASPQDAEGKPKVLGSAPESLYDGYKVPQIV